MKTVTLNDWQLSILVLSTLEGTLKIAQDINKLVLKNSRFSSKRNEIEIDSLKRKLQAYQNLSKTLENSMNSK